MGDCWSCGDFSENPSCEDYTFWEWGCVPAHRSQPQGELVEGGNGFRDLAWRTVGPADGNRRRITLNLPWPDDLMELVWGWRGSPWTVWSCADYRPSQQANRE